MSNFSTRKTAEQFAWNLWTHNTAALHSIKQHCTAHNTFKLIPCFCSLLYNYMAVLISSCRLSECVVLFRYNLTRSMHRISLTYRLKVSPELLYSIASWHLGCKQLYVVHVRNQSNRCPSSNTATTSHKKWATGFGQRAINTCNVLKDLFEDKDVQFAVFTSCKRQNYQNKSYCTLLLYDNVFCTRTGGSVNESLVCDLSNGSYWRVFSCGTV